MKAHSQLFLSCGLFAIITIGYAQEPVEPAEPVESRRNEEPAVRVGNSNKVDVTPYVQEGFYTCWAVCAEMIMDSLGGGQIRQCEQAALAKRVFSCCLEDGVLSEACDFQWFPMFQEWGFSHRFQRTPLRWEQVKEEIDARRPIAFSWMKNPQLAHMNVLVGYQELTIGDRRIEYLEPNYNDEPDVRNAPFEDYDGTSGLFRHQSTYFMIGAEGAE